MDSISNAVSDSCAPQIVPNVEPQTVDGRWGWWSHGVRAFGGL